MVRLTARRSGRWSYPRPARTGRRSNDPVRGLRPRLPPVNTQLQPSAAVRAEVGSVAAELRGSTFLGYSWRPRTSCRARTGFGSRGVEPRGPTVAHLGRTE